MRRGLVRVARPRRAGACAFAASLVAQALAPLRAAAEPHAPSDVLSAPAPPRPEPRLPSPLPEIGAVFPGVLVHGTGPWLQRRGQTAERLLWLEGAGLLTTFVSGYVLARTGAARDLVGPTALGAVAGVNMFGLSLLSQLYATWAPADGFGAPRRVLPQLESRVGYLYVEDPQFAFRHFVTARVDGRLGPWHVAAGAAGAPGRDNERVELYAGYRLFGASAPLVGERASPARDGSYLEPVVGYSEHHFDPDGFVDRVLELKVEGRLDLQRYLPDVRGAFFQGEAGYARQWFAFDLPGVSDVTATSLLIAHVGFGLYLGGRGAPDTLATGGELEVYYDHRHDGFAGGLKVRGLGSGVAGHFGVLGSYQLTPRWGVNVRGEVGSARTVGLSLVLRAGS